MLHFFSTTFIIEESNWNTLVQKWLPHLKQLQRYQKPQLCDHCVYYHQLIHSHKILEQEVHPVEVTQLLPSCHQIYHYDIPLALMVADITPTMPTSQPYSEWLLQWNSHMRSAQDTMQVSFEATHITTPLILHHWSILLAEYSDKALVRFIITGISNGFKIGINHPAGSLLSVQKNLYCFLQHPSVEDQYLSEKHSHYRVAKAFNITLVLSAHVSRFGVIPKNHQPNN